MFLKITESNGQNLSRPLDNGRVSQCLRTVNIKWPRHHQLFNINRMITEQIGSNNQCLMILNAYTMRPNYHDLLYLQMENIS